MERGGKLTEPCSLPSVGAAASEALVVHPEPRISLERWNIRLNLAAVRPRNPRGPPLQLEARAWSFSRKPGQAPDVRRVPKCGRAEKHCQHVPSKRPQGNPSVSMAPWGSHMERHLTQNSPGEGGTFLYRLAFNVPSQE